MVGQKYRSKYNSLESQRGQNTRMKVVVIKTNSHQEERALRPLTTLRTKYRPLLERLGINLAIEGFIRLAFTHIATLMLRIKKMRIAVIDLLMSTCCQPHCNLFTSVRRFVIILNAFLLDQFAYIEQGLLLLLRY